MESVKINQLDDQPDGFVIDNDKTADWAIQKIMRARKDAERFAQLYEDKLRAVMDELERTEAYFYPMLRDYMTTCPDVRKTKTQASYKLPSGTLMVKTQAPKYTPDDDALARYLEAAGRSDCIEVVKKPKWGEYKKSCELVDDQLVDKDTGEIVQGVAVEIRQPKFEVKTDG